MLFQAHSTGFSSGEPGQIGLFRARLIRLMTLVILMAGLLGCAKPFNPNPPRSGLIEQMLASDVLLLGELHDQPLHHRQRLEWIGELSERRPLAIVMEQLDARMQPALDAERAVESEVTETIGARARRIAQAAGFDFKGWTWAFYRPVIELALQRGLPIHAGNLSREEAMQIARGQSHRLAERPPVGWTDAVQEELNQSIVDGHCGLLPATMIAPMALAQRARDAQIAEVAVRAAADGRLAVVIAGNGHVRRDYGIPIHLADLRPGARVLTVGLIERGGEDQSKLFDAVWSAPPLQREDPCAALRKRFARAEPGGR
jgi:uncharacterized iron-regulated protein